MSKPDDYSDFTEVMGFIGELDFAGATKDILAGIDHARSLPEVDPERVVVWGYCTGGTLAMLGAALCWAVSIVYVRAHRWISTPFQLVFWQILLATLVVSMLALIKDGVPHPAWTPQLAGLFFYSGIIGTALAMVAAPSLQERAPAGRTRRPCGRRLSPCSIP